MGRAQEGFHTDAPDLVATVRARIGRAGRMSAVYSDASWTEDQYGVRRVLSIGIANSDLPSAAVATRDALLRVVAEAGASWLFQRSLLTPGTLISITLIREVDLKLISWSWGVGGQAFWIDAAGQLSTQEPHLESDPGHPSSS